MALLSFPAATGSSDFVVPRDKAGQFRPSPECPKGHGYTTANTYVAPSGKRYCRECRRVARRTRYAAAKGGAK